MHLSKTILPRITNAEIPQASYFRLPEKVLQFGTGVLLRGLPGYYIDKANKAGVFNGRIVVVKSTGSGDTDAFAKQDALYTHCVCGIQKGEKVKYNIVNAAISRVLSATNEWNTVLECAANPALQLVISNTTEVGISYVNESIFQTPPASFPAKLLSFLYRRFEVFGGADDKGLVIVPTELIIDNGTKLKDIVLQLAQDNHLPGEFVHWLHNSNIFCNSLVDRIVPGSPPVGVQEEIEASLGYTDQLLIMSEPYSLWAIETSDARATGVLSFAAVDDSVIITPDITLYRELKLRLLNGSHTFCCGLTIFAGYMTVEGTMRDESFTSFLQSLMLDEIAPAIPGDSIPGAQKEAFAAAVIDRFRNPFIEHHWMNITLQYSSKMAMRNVPLLINFYQRFGRVPERMALGFAAHLVFMNSKATQGIYIAWSNGRTYAINDNRAGYYCEVWQQQQDAEAVANTILANEELWGQQPAATARVCGARG